MLEGRKNNGKNVQKGQNDCNEEGGREPNAREKEKRRKFRKGKAQRELGITPPKRSSGTKVTTKKKEETKAQKRIWTKGKQREKIGKRRTDVTIGQRGEGKGKTKRNAKGARRHEKPRKGEAEDKGLKLGNKDLKKKNSGMRRGFPKSTGRKG